MSNKIHLQWSGEHRFEAGRPNGQTIHIDGSGATGPSPVDTLLSALAGCAAVDIVDILAKRRTPATSLTIDVVAERVDGTPRRLKHVMLNVAITGPGIERQHAERAIDLAVNKYCSVRDSLREDIPVEWTLTLHDTAVAATPDPV